MQENNYFIELKAFSLRFLCATGAVDQHCSSPESAWESSAMDLRESVQNLKLVYNLDALLLLFFTRPQNLLTLVNYTGSL